MSGKTRVKRSQKPEKKVEIHFYGGICVIRAEGSVLLVGGAASEGHPVPRFRSYFDVLGRAKASKTTSNATPIPAPYRTDVGWSRICQMCERFMGACSLWGRVYPLRVRCHWNCV
jgi:hypothetical protein